MSPVPKIPAAEVRADPKPGSPEPESPAPASPEPGGAEFRFHFAGIVVELLADGEVQSVRAVCGVFDREACLPQSGDHEFRSVRVVFNDQDCFAGGGSHNQ